MREAGCRAKLKVGRENKTKARSFGLASNPGPSLLSATESGFASPLCLAAPALSSASGGGGYEAAGIDLPAVPLLQARLSQAGAHLQALRLREHLLPGM
jgi:hypothetical protein